MKPILFAFLWALAVACGPSPGFHCENSRNTPDGKFKAVSITSTGEACGVRESGVVVCWHTFRCE